MTELLITKLAALGIFSVGCPPCFFVSTISTHWCYVYVAGRGYNEAPTDAAAAQLQRPPSTGALI